MSQVVYLVLVLGHQMPWSWSYLQLCAVQYLKGWEPLTHLFSPNSLSSCRPPPTKLAFKLQIGDSAVLFPNPIGSKNHMVTPPMPSLILPAL